MQQYCHKCLSCLHGQFGLSYAVHVTRSITINLFVQIKNLSLCVRPVKCALLLCCGSLTLLLKFPKETELLLHQVKCHWHSAHFCHSRHCSLPIIAQHNYKTLMNKCTLRWFALFNCMPTGNSRSSSNGWSNANAQYTWNRIALTHQLVSGLHKMVWAINLKQTSVTSKAQQLMRCNV